MRIWSVAGVLAALISNPAAGFDGFYVGLQGGYSNFDVGTHIESPSGSVATFDSSADNFIGGGFAGYGLTYDAFNQRFYIGFEGEGVWNGADGELFDGPGGVSLDLETGESFGATGRFGFLVMDRALIYARAGWQWTHFELRSSGPGGDRSQSEMLDNLRVGVGAEIPVTEPFHVGFDWTYTFYGDISDDTVAVPIAGTGTTARLDREEKDESRFMLRGSWLFAGIR